ncbi:sigma-70 family RNA polymerase sigma factor [Fictibacillus gelatini]|uniref:sigma-70 family RNA polymerase sigma factor n=1 Tax=Fictibacillus gelatini TaxID=225985 RepID=UPI00042229A9|nr:sigma-70 family RNA polymerase sigma factor [Fictibacillus gelatini]
MKEKVLFEELVKQFEPLILAQIKSLKVAHHFDDYYQIGLVGLWEAYSRFNEEKGAFSAFALKTVRGKMLNQLKKEVRYSSIHGELTQEQEAILPSENGDQPLETDILKEYLEPLTEKQRKWVVGRIFLQKGEKEIAEAEGVTVHAVKSWRKQALKNLRKTVARGLE